MEWPKQINLINMGSHLLNAALSLSQFLPYSHCDSFFFLSDGGTYVLFSLISFSDRKLVWRWRFVSQLSQTSNSYFEKNLLAKHTANRIIKGLQRYRCCLSWWYMYWNKSTHYVLGGKGGGWECYSYLGRGAHPFPFNFSTMQILRFWRCVYFSVNCIVMLYWLRNQNKCLRVS